MPRPARTIDLPSASSSPIPSAPGPGGQPSPAPTELLTVALSANGGVTVNGTPASLDELVRLAQAAHDAFPEARAMIAADASVTYGKVIEVMDRLRQGGIQRIAFAVQATR